MPGRPLHIQSQPANQVLAEIDDRAARWRCADRHRCDLLDPPHRWARWREQCRKIALDWAHSYPILVVVARCGPAGALQARIVAFAIIDVAGHDRATRSAPG